MQNNLNTIRNNIIKLTLAFLAITALPGGFMLMLEPSGSLLELSVSQLSASPFVNYFFPGMLLFIFPGMGAVSGFVALYLKKSYAAEVIFANGISTLIWIVTEAFMIRELHFLQFVYLIVGALLVIFPAGHLFKGTLVSR